MFAPLTNLFRRTTRTRRPAGAARLRLEALEGRDCASVTVTNPLQLQLSTSYRTFTPVETRINITGDNLANEVEVVQYPSAERIDVFVEGAKVKSVAIKPYSTVVLDVDLAGGNDRFTYRVETSPLGDVNLHRPLRLTAGLGDGHDTAVLDLANTSFGEAVYVKYTADIAVNGGPGADQVIATFGLIREDGHVDYRVDLGAGGGGLAQVALTNQVGDIIAGGTSSIQMYGGDDSPDNLQLRMFVDGPNDGNGQVGFYGDGQAMTAVLDGRGGDDKVMAEGDVSFFGAGLGLTLDGGAGNDTVTAKLRKLDYSLPGALEIAVRGGLGNDTLGLSVTTVGPQQVGDATDQLLIDGGLGTDKVYAWSTQAVRFSCEGIL